MDSSHHTENEHRFHALLPTDDASELAGLYVEIHESGKILDHGRVEAATLDGQIFWLAQEGADTRRLWELQPGRTVRITAGTAPQDIAPLTDR